jgi:uncharacterized protein
MTTQEKIDRFLKSPAFGVVGASTNPAKYGNKVVKAYKQNNLDAIPVNPKADEIEGLRCVSQVSDLPNDVASISIITPPSVTEQVIEQAIEKGIQHVWMQPGAESPKAVERAENAGLTVIADGSCALVVLGYHE